MENAIIILILLALIVGIARYLFKARKRGQACIGCPCSKGCSGHCGNSHSA